jgi:hypothetical protein
MSHNSGVSLPGLQQRFLQALSESIAESSFKIDLFCSFRAAETAVLDALNLLG